MKYNVDSKIFRYAIYSCILIVVVFIAYFLDDTDWFFRTISVPSKIGFCLVQVFFVYTAICTIRYYDAKKKLKDKQKMAIDHIINLTFIIYNSSQTSRVFTDDVIKYAYKKYDECIKDDRSCSDYRTKNGRVYCAWPSNAIMFGIVSTAQYAAENCLDDLQDFCDSIIEDCHRASLPKTAW